MSSSYTATDVQKAKLEKLMQNIDKPIEIPQRPKGSKFAEPPDFIRNIMGSSAGAGSGEFHVYRHLRRKEYARQRFIEEQAKHEELDKKFKERVEEKKRKVEEKTAKKRAKRLRKKEKMKEVRKAKKQNRGQAKETTEEDTDDDEVDEKDETKSTSKSDTINRNENPNEKVKLHDDKLNTSGTPVTQSKELESDSDDEVIGPLPADIKNCDNSSTEIINSERTHSKSTQQVSDNLDKSAVNKDESDVVTGPTPPSNDKDKCKMTYQKDDENDDDDEIIGPMPN